MTDSLSHPDAQRALAEVLDELIPPRADGSLLGAGGLGLGSYVAEQLGVAGAIVLAGLAKLDELAAQRGSSSFAEVSQDRRAELINEVASSHPGFIESLIFHTYAGYYQDPRVVESLGVSAHPPYPKGFDLEAGDLSLLDAVRARPKQYREA